MVQGLGSSQPWKYIPPFCPYLLRCVYNFPLCQRPGMSGTVIQKFALLQERKKRRWGRKEGRKASQTLLWSPAFSSKRELHSPSVYTGTIFKN